SLPDPLPRGERGNACLDLQVIESRHILLSPLTGEEPGERVIRPARSLRVFSPGKCVPLVGLSTACRTEQRYRRSRRFFFPFSSRPMGRQILRSASMAVGLGPLPVLHPVPGFELGIASAGIKRPGRKDVVVMRCAEGSRVAGVTTTNAFCAAPVIVTRERLGGEVRYLLTNTGNANAGTGPDGLARARRACARLAELAGVGEEAVLPFSTGVIGEPLPVEKIESALQAALEDLREDNWEAAATGIMTTDTQPKGASRQFVHDGVTITVTGIS